MSRNGHEKKRLDPRVKWERNAYSEGKNLTFFSMEYLTDSQIEALGVKPGVNK